MYVSNTVQVQKTNVAAAEAAGAGGSPAWQQNGASVKTFGEWYTIVVYERPRSKTVVVYAHGRAFVFRMSAGAIVSAEVLKVWRIGKTLAYSAHIHVTDLSELLNEYAREKAARIPEPLLHIVKAESYREEDKNSDGR
jgi:hypothetical protein